jgi:hypothetical protein
VAFVAALLLLVEVGVAAAAQTAAPHCHPAAAAHLLPQLTLPLPQRPSCHRYLLPATAASTAGAAAAAPSLGQQCYYQDLLTLQQQLLLVLVPRLL